MNRRTLLGSGVAAVLGAGVGNAFRVEAQATPAVEANPAFRVLFIRHAESQINELRAIEIPGQPLPPDSGVSYPLTQEGTQQAIALAELLRDVDLQAIYASTRLRALQTADAIAFAQLWLANPDLPARIRAGGPYNEADRATFYGGDHRGYTDYPTLA